MLWLIGQVIAMQDGNWERASTNGVSPKKSPKSTEKTQKPQKTQYPQYVKAVNVKKSTSAWARGRNATRGRPKRRDLSTIDMLGMFWHVLSFQRTNVTMFLNMLFKMWLKAKLRKP